MLAAHIARFNTGSHVQVFQRQRTGFQQCLGNRCFSGSVGADQRDGCNIADRLVRATSLATVWLSGSGFCAIEDIFIVQQTIFFSCLNGTSSPRSSSNLESGRLQSVGKITAIDANMLLFAKVLFAFFRSNNRRVFVCLSGSKSMGTEINAQPPGFSTR